MRICDPGLFDPAALIATGWSEPVPGRVTPAVDHRLSRRTRFADLEIDPTLSEKHGIRPLLRHQWGLKKADQILDKRFNASAHPNATMICFDVAKS